MTTIVLSVIGVALAFAFFVRLGPRLGGATVTQPAPAARGAAAAHMEKRTINVGGKEVQVDIAGAVRREGAGRAAEPAKVAAPQREKLWLYFMIGIAGIVGLFSVVTMAFWFYFLVRSDGKAPDVLTEMLKYLVSTLLGVFVGFMGGSSVNAGNQSENENESAAPPGDQDDEGGAQG